MSEYDSTSRPVEVYRFEIDGFDPMLFTSDSEDVVAEGDTYEALPGLSRSSLIIAPLGEDGADLTVTVPATSLLVRRVGLFLTPPRVRLKFRRYQRSDLSTPTMRRDLTMASAKTKGTSCSLVFPSPFDAGLAPRLPKNKIQQPCNWILGDRNCRINLDLFKATVTSIAEAAQFTRTLAGQYIVQADWADGVTPYDTKLWVGGVISGVVGDVTDRRTIYEVEEHRSRIGIVVHITLSSRFEIPLADAAFSITPGCDNSFARCAELNNTPQFGGFPHVTERENPFEVRFDETRDK